MQVARVCSIEDTFENCFASHISNNSIQMFISQRVSQVRTCSGVLMLILGFREKTRVLQKKLFSNGKEMRENINDTKSETEYAPVEVPLKMHRTASNETALISEIQNTVNEENSHCIRTKGNNQF